MKDYKSYFLGRALFIGIGLSYIFTVSESMFWLSEIIGYIIGLIFIKQIKQFNNYKFINKINIIILILLLGIIFVNLSHTLYLDETPLLLITSITMISAYLVSLVKNNAFVRMNNILFKISITIIILAFLLLIPYINISYMEPINIHKCGNILYGASLYMTFSLYPIISIDEFDKKNIIKNYTISSLTITLISFLIVAVMGLKEATFYRYPEYILFKRIQILDFISNVDSIFFFIIILDLLLSLSMCYKKFDNKKRSIVLIISIILVNFICDFTRYLNVLFIILPYYIFISFFMTIIPKINKYKNKIK